MRKLATAYIRNTPTLAYGLGVLLLLSLLHFSSNGVIRSGGDEDSGSGIGGTGRMLQPGGESGIGGTGFKPFLGMSETKQVEILYSEADRSQAITASLPTTVITAGLSNSTRPKPEHSDSEITNSALSSSLQFKPGPIASLNVSRAAEQTQGSAAINIGEAIQRSVDADALYFEELREQLTAIELLAKKTDENVFSPEAASTTLSTKDQVSWDAVAKLLNDARAQAPKVTSLADAGTSSSDPARQARPERIQRPELPPIQRISPLQRTAILPPRVQPLRL